MIHAKTNNKLHWNYFIALEHDLELVSRYIEFCEPNLGVYSIELAHLLFAAASEVDVIAKLLCRGFHPNQKRENIIDYRTILLPAIPDLPTTRIYIQRYNLDFAPWDNWASPANINPFWWQSYNHVKHQRDVCFNEATLQHVLNAMGALLILIYHYYSFELSPVPGQKLPPKGTTRELKPTSTLLRLHDDFYYSHVIV